MWWAAPYTTAGALAPGTSPLIQCVLNRDDQIFVTGGTGFIGSYLLRYLVREGYRNIRAVRRAGSDMTLAAPVADKVEWVKGDIRDIFFLEDGMQNARWVFHCAAQLSFQPREVKEMMQINVEGTANVVNTALFAGVEKLVHVSSIEAVGRSKNGATLRENNIWQRSRFNTNYAVSKFLGEQEVWRAAAEGLTTAVVNPAVVLGGGRWEDGPLQFFRLAWNNFPLYPAGASGFVDVRDVARFMVHLMESQINGERFLLSAENMSYQLLMERLAHYLDRRPPGICLQPWMQGLAWRLSWLQRRLSSRPSPITRETALIASSTFFIDPSKSRSALDFDYLPIEETLAATAQRFREAAQNDFAPRLLPLV